MALVNSSFTVNVTPGAMPPVVHVSEYDVGRTYTVTINGENGSAFNIPTGTTATVEGTLNGEIGFTTTATIANNAVSFALTESMTAKSGKAWCKIKLTLNNEPIQTCAFVLAVDRAGVESDTVVGAPGFDEQIQDAVYDYLDENGQDAVSPQVTITSITGGHRVTITDSEHPNGQYFDVMDGEDDSGGAVESVNGQTGVVVLDASDVGALPDDTQIPSKTSDLTNDSGFVTAQQAAASAPVQSVNGQTGAVVLGAADVHALPDSTVIPPTVTEQAVAGWGFTKNTGTYSKPSGGIPKSDLASGVIPVVPQMATDSNMSDWTSGKTVDAAVLKQGVQYIERMIEEKPGYSDIPTDNAQLGNGAGYQTAQQVQTAVAAIPAVRYDAAQSISSAQKQQARENIGAGTYSKPSGGIPASDLADGVIPIVPSASAAAPLMDGTAAAGSSAAYARGDHVHPSDTTKLGVSDNAYRAASIPMGHVDSTSTATAFTATVPGITELRDGVCMWLRNGVITSASGFTLNVNGLGAKPCYSSLAAASRSTTIFNVNYTMLFVYNSTRVEGGCWDIVYGVDTNTTYTPPKLGFGYAVCTTAAATAAKTASISSYALNTGGIVSIRFDNDVPPGATLNISSKGAKAIYHRGAAITADVIKAGDVATFIYSTYYHLIAIDRDEVGGSTITVDDAMSSSSENPVQNKVVQAALDAKADASSIPTVPVQSVNGKTGAVSLNAEDVGAFSETDGAVLESRIDAAISSVTTDSEVQDIRVASDGTVYAAAGTAVRTQFDALNALTVKTESRNLWNPNDPDFGAGVRLYADGNTTEGNYNTSGYMRATPGDILYATYMSGTAVSGVWVAYNALKAIITGSGVSADNYTVPTGAFYVRFCVYKNYDKLLQVEVGSKTPYKPYQETELYLDRTKLSTANAKTNALTDVILGYVCYKGKLNNTTGGFATAPIEIPDGATTLYMRTTTAAGFTVAQYFDTNMSYIDGSVGNIVLNNTHALTLNQSAKYIQLSGTGWSDDYAGTILLTFSFDTFTLLDNGVKSVSEPGIGYDAISIFGKREYPSAFINSVAHRGYTQVAPENTLPAFIAARKYGYDRAELDVQWTSNRVPVVLHDGSINETGRNADGTAISGTIDIEDITYQQALSYDFGIWFDQKFAGTKIPTLEEVLTLAKRIGLHLNIELKAESHPTQSDVENVVALVKAHSMEEYVSFHSTATTLLGYVHAAMPDATLAIIVQQITQTQIDSALALKGNNKVYLSSSVYGSSEVALCKSNGIGLSVWTLNTESAITALDPYVSSVTSDKLHAGFVLYKSAMGE